MHTTWGSTSIRLPVLEVCPHGDRPQVAVQEFTRNVQFAKNSDKKDDQMNKVLVLFETEPGFRSELSEILSGYNIVFIEAADTGSIDAETASETVIVFGNPKADFLGVCPRLKWLQLQTAGADAYVNGELDEKVLLS